MLNLNWKVTDYRDMQDKFNACLPDSLYMSHYELSEQLGYTPDMWYRFVNEPKVKEYIDRELTALQNTEMNKLLRDIGSSDKMRSQGLAQVISAMNKKIETTPKKSGPIFIVMATPLNEEELKSPNVRKN